MADKARRSGTGFIQGSSTGKKVGRSKLIGRKVQEDNSAVSQLRKALQSIHINQRVVSAKIVLAKSRFEPLVSIDGYPLPDLGTVESIQVSRVIKYQEDPGHSASSSINLRDHIIK